MVVWGAVPVAHFRELADFQLLVKAAVRAYGAGGA